MAEQKTEPTINVRIVSPEKTLFEGLARSITCFNKEGEFDILPFHSNFISLIYKSITVNPVDTESQRFEIGYALLKCMGNSITILTNVDISSYSEMITAQHPSETPEST